MTTTTSNFVRAESVSGVRWGFLAICVVCMIMIANLQYGWTLFVNPINKTHGWSIASIQVAFSIFIALETWLTPIRGWIVDVLGPRRGPKLMVAFGGITVAIGRVIMPTPLRWTCFISARLCRARVAAPYMRPASAMR